jgi:hypothetical protein
MQSNNNNKIAGSLNPVTPKLTFVNVVFISSWLHPKSAQEHETALKPTSQPPAPH